MTECKTPVKLHPCLTATRSASFLDESVFIQSIILVSPILYFQFFNREPKSSDIPSFASDERPPVFSVRGDIKLEEKSEIKSKEKSEKIKGEIRKIKGKYQK